MLTLPVLLLLMVVVAGSAGMVGVFGWLMHRLSRLEGGAAELQRLLADNAELREQLEAVRSEMGSLGERVDFAEKLLEGGGPPGALGPGDADG